MGAGTSAIKHIGHISNIMVVEPCQKVLKVSIWEYWIVGVLKIKIS
jgi:hypothetical protein